MFVFWFGVLCGSLFWVTVVSCLLVNGLWLVAG